MIASLYRRSRSLTAHWQRDYLEVANYRLGTRALIAADDVALLAALTSWRTLADLRDEFPQRDEKDLRAALEQFGVARLIEESGDLEIVDHAALRNWEPWDPVASQFHGLTRNVPYAGRERAHEILDRYTAEASPPPPLKDLPGERIPLPAFARDGEVPRALLSRRSWRSFGAQPLSQQHLADLAGLTFAVQQWAEVNGQRVALKTSPSGGACHSIEAYWAVRNVAGLPAGLYHYAPDAHAFTPLPGPWTWDRVLGYFPGQPWFAAANAIVFMTSMFERTQWKYRHPRAYRVVLLEAGHLCQTFCVTATWLGLAPLCSAALADSEIEGDLGVDGLSEAVLYAAAVGTRPPDVAWAPWPEVDRRPATSPPAYERASGPGNEEP